MFAKPSWQTEDLEEEWVEEDDEHEGQDSPPANSQRDTHTTSDISFTNPIGSLIMSDKSDAEGHKTNSSGAGTVVFHESQSEDEARAPLLLQTPARGKNILGKDLFSPLSLEKMFEPPSPPSLLPLPTAPPSRSSAPAIPSRLSQVYIPGENDTTTSLELSEKDSYAENNASLEEGVGTGDNEGGKTKYQFTFAAPRLGTSSHPTGSIPNAQSTPLPQTPMRNEGEFLQPPLTDPRLRLFQFQYDTFTREHLSAMVDTIAVNTPSGGSGTTSSKETTPAASSSQVTERSISRLRSAKRLKLSPASDFSEDGDGAAVIMRPQSRRDYVGESKSLMEKIRQARDISTISTQGISQTPVSGQENWSPDDVERNDLDMSFLAVPGFRLPSEGSSAWTGSSGSRPSYSSLAIREQAASLMNQIRSDVKSHKRLFSVDSNGSMVQNDARSLLSQAQSDDAAHEEPVFEGDTEIISGGESDPEPSSRRNSSQRPAESSGNAIASVESHVEGRLVDGLGRLTLDVNRSFNRPPETHVSSLQPSALAIAPGSGADGKITFLSPLPAATLPNYPAGSLHGGRKEDLNRFVSSSTASGGTITSTSTASFVKHQGPKHITHISPDDLPPLPDRVGKMVFDRTIMKWVKASSAQDRNVASTGTMKIDGSSESEDPFRDIDSIRDDDAAAADAENIEHDNNDDMSLDESRADSAADSGPEDEEEAELTSFSFDASATEHLAIPVPDSAIDSQDESNSEDGEDTVTSGQFTSINLLNGPFANGNAPHTAVQPPRQEPALQDTSPQRLAPSSTQVVTPQPSSRDPAPTPVIRSALKSASVTPVSALKDPKRGRTQTPANTLGHRRSVSFSDGKREGPIAGLGRNVPTPEGSVDTDSGSLSDTGLSGPSTALIPSARSKRIADMLEGLEDTSYDDDSPSKASSGRGAEEGLQPLGARRPGGSAKSASGREVVSRRTFSQSYSAKGSKLAGLNATFLTECSFGIAHDRLVEVITDVQPFEPYWEQLSAIDLSNKSIDSVARLKEFLPRLDSLSLNSNQIGWLSGIPGTVRTLSIASNCLTAVTSFSHLLNLESLDITRNNIDSLRQLECLRHLRELRADGNFVNSLDGLQKMDGLVKLSLQGNSLHGVVDLTSYRWARLEMLNLSHNRLSSIVGLSSLPALIALNLDNNQLTDLAAEGAMPRLRILRASGNRLQELNAGPWPNLRTLYADSNSLGPILKAHRLTKLENLSLRNQSGRAGLQLSVRDVRDVKRLYLSGNPLKAGFISEPCYNLVYLELAACRLTSLPADLARLAPNLRNLNLNYNFLEDVRPLEGLTRMRKLTIIGSRVKVTKQLVKMLRGMLDVEMLDFRMNPCPLGWYLPLLVKGVPGALQPSDGDRRHGFSNATDGQQHQQQRRGRELSLASRTDGEQQQQQRNGLVVSSSKGGARDPLAPPDARGPTAGAAPSTSSGGSSSNSRQTTATASWKELDAKFRRDLPDEAYVGRLAYRGLVMRACPGIRMLDGVEASAKEREKAEGLLRSVVESRRGRQAQTVPAGPVQTQGQSRAQTTGHTLGQGQGQGRAGRGQAHVVQ